MFKRLLVLLLVLVTLAEPLAAVAEPLISPTTTEASVDARPPVPRPNYKRYKGRKKHRKPGFFKRRKARRAAMRKRKAVPRKGVISVDAPTRN